MSAMKKRDDHGMKAMNKQKVRWKNERMKTERWKLSYLPSLQKLSQRASSRTCLEDLTQNCRKLMNEQKRKRKRGREKERKIWGMCLIGYAQ